MKRRLYERPNTLAIVHKTEGLVRRCGALDIISVSGGLQCGNCLAHNVPEPENRCTGRAGNGKDPCPLMAGRGDTLCWYHRMRENMS